MVIPTLRLRGSSWVESFFWVGDEVVADPDAIDELAVGLGEESEASDVFVGAVGIRGKPRRWLLDVLVLTDVCKTVEEPSRLSVAGELEDALLLITTVSRSALEVVVRVPPL